MKFIFSLMMGLLFGFGLMLTGMYSMDIILAGLKIGASTFKYNLYITFITALAVTFLIFQFRHFFKKPLTNSCYMLPTMSQIDWKLIAGSTLFGIGWGTTGLCPGPNLVGLGIYSWPTYWVNFSGMIVGFIIAKALLRILQKNN